MAKSGFKKSEWLIILVAVLLLLGAGWYFFFGGGFLEHGDVEGGKRVGVLSESRGAVRREQIGQTVFSGIEPNSALFNEDTLVTGADSSARLELDDGSTIDLGPDAMIRLAFESEFSLTGINRIPKVDVVAGQVTGRAKTRELRIRSGEKVISIPKETAQTLAPPVWKRTAVPENSKPVARVNPPPVVAHTPPPPPLPPPSPAPPPPPPEKISRIVLLSPKSGALLSIAAGVAPPRIPITFEWQVSPPDTSLVFKLHKSNEEGMAPLVTEAMPQVESGRGSFSWTAEKPGQYVWELSPDSGKVAKPREAKATFQVDPEFEGIRLLEPLVAGQKQASNRLQERVLKNFDIALRWEAYPGIKNYRVELAKSATGKPIMVREVEGTTLSLNRDKLFTGEIHYRVRGTTPAGFRVSSARAPFRFSFLPPSLALPKDGSKFPIANRGKVLLTWQKTNFTKNYDVEIARDPDFRTVYVRTVTRENFFVLPNPPPGEFYWRVKSMNGKVTSSMSSPFRFSVAQRRSAAPDGQGVNPSDVRK